MLSRVLDFLRGFRFECTNVPLAFGYKFGRSFDHCKFGEVITAYTPMRCEAELTIEDTIRFSIQSGYKQIYQFNKRTNNKISDHSI